MPPKAKRAKKQAETKKKKHWGDKCIAKLYMKIKEGSVLGNDWFEKELPFLPVIFEKADFKQAARETLWDMQLVFSCVAILFMLYKLGGKEEVTPLTPYFLSDTQDSSEQVKESFNIMKKNTRKKAVGVWYYGEHFGIAIVTVHYSNNAPEKCELDMKDSDPFHHFNTTAEAVMIVQAAYLQWITDVFGIIPTTSMNQKSVRMAKQSPAKICGPAAVTEIHNCLFGSYIAHSVSDDPNPIMKCEGRKAVLLWLREHVLTLEDKGLLTRGGGEEEGKDREDLEATWKAFKEDSINWLPQFKTKS